MESSELKAMRIRYLQFAIRAKMKEHAGNSVDIATNYTALPSIQLNANLKFHLKKGIGK